MVVTIRTWAEAQTQSVVRIGLILVMAWLVARLLRLVVKTQAKHGPALLRELRRRVKKAFDQAGIEIPFPHVKVVRGHEGVA